MAVKAIGLFTKHLSKGTIGRRTEDLYCRLVVPLRALLSRFCPALAGYKIEDPRFLNPRLQSEKKSGLETKSDKILKKILKYNEDDVRATLAIKEWLEQQKPTKGRERLE